MSVYINQKIIHDAADTTIIPVNRWSQPGNYSFQVDSGSWDLEITLDRVNRENVTAVYSSFFVTDDTGAQVASTGLTNGLYQIVNLPAEAISCASAAAGVAKLMQNGSSGG